MKNMIIIALILALLVSLYWNYQQKSNPQNQEITKARKDFQKLRLLINEWNVFKGHKEIKELVEAMRNNSILEEKI